MRSKLTFRHSSNFLFSTLLSPLAATNQTTQSHVGANFEGSNTTSITTEETLLIEFENIFLTFLMAVNALGAVENGLALVLFVQLYRRDLLAPIPAFMLAHQAVWDAFSSLFVVGLASPLFDNMTPGECHGARQSVPVFSPQLVLMLRFVAKLFGLRPVAVRVSGQNHLQLQCLQSRRSQL